MKAVPGMNAATVRASLRDLMRVTVRQEKDWHYLQKRPLPLGLATLAVPVFTDCSGGIVLLCKWAGAPDPTGGRFDGYGNSQSFFRHLPHVPWAQADPGDIVVIGRVDGEEHAVMVYEAGIDPVVWSHGQEAGPLFARLSAELRAHPGARATFLKLLPDDPKPQRNPETRVDVTRDGRPWLTGQKVSNPALWQRIRKAAVSAKSLRIRRSKP